MAKKTQTVTTCTCDLCGNECDETDGIVEIQVDGGDGRDVGPGFIRGRIDVFLPYRAERGEVCKPCLLKWLCVYVKNQGKDHAHQPPSAPVGVDAIRIADDLESWVNDPFVTLTPMRKMDVEDFVRRIRAVAQQPAAEPQPVAWQFQDREGKWHGFMDERHRQNTIADGSWPVRPLYTTPPSVPVVDRALEYLRPHLEEGTFSAPDWAIQLASILTGGDAKVEPARNNPYALAQQPTSSAPDPAAGDAVAMQPVAEVAMSDDGYKIGLLGPLRAHRLPLGTKLYASPRAAISGANAPVGVEAALSLLRAGNWREVHIGRRCMRLEVTYDYAAWERLMEQVEAALAHQPPSTPVVDRALEYLRPHLEAGTFSAPDWAIQLASILTGGDGCGKPQPPSVPVGVEGLPRYGFLDGNEPRPVPCADGYWTPWHLAQQPAAFDFAAHLHRQREWSETTFGPGARTAGLIDHIRKELLEIEAAPHDGEEWIDAVILALDGAWRCGLTPQQIVDGIVAKQAKNERRTWPDWRTADPTKAIEHDRASEQTAAVDGMADFEIHAGGEYFASVFGQREQAWEEAMHYVFQMSPEDGEPEVFEVTRRKVTLPSQPGGSDNDR